MLFQNLIKSSRPDLTRLTCSIGNILKAYMVTSWFMEPKIDVGTCVINYANSYLIILGGS